MGGGQKSNPDYYRNISTQTMLGELTIYPPIANLL